MHRYIDFGEKNCGERRSPYWFKTIVLKHMFKVSFPTLVSGIFLVRRRGEKDVHPYTVLVRNCGQYHCRLLLDLTGRRVEEWSGPGR